MSDVKHTPGPWVWRWKTSALHRAGENGPRFGDHIASLKEDDNGSAMISDADADLIAAAPEMLEALPDLSHVISWLENGCDPAKAVAKLKIYQQRINQERAKATGGQP